MKRWIEKILDFLPVPFWVYFFSIVAATIGLLPHQSPVYDWTTRHVLPAAIILMLIGTPVTELVTMGPQALRGMAIGTATIFVSQVIAYVVMIRFLPDDAWKSVGALMGTWIGGSANMVAVKEIVQLSDGGLGVLVIVDTILSYLWMALLLSGTKFQERFDRGMIIEHSAAEEAPPTGPAHVRILAVVVIGFLAAEASVLTGKAISGISSVLPVNGWILLVASTLAIVLATTPLRSLKLWGSQNVGTLFLYAVLVTIGAKTSLAAALQTPVFLVYGIITLTLHGVLFLVLGRLLRVPLFLLTTASQANIGGAVSAPIVAEAYRPGTAHVGVLMGVLGAILGTYMGVGGAYLCRSISVFLR